MDSISNFLSAATALQQASADTGTSDVEMSTFVEKALCAADELVRLNFGNTGGFLTRDGATTVARVWAQAYSRNQEGADYLPRTNNEAASFVPHAWVIAALMHSYRAGHENGHAEGIRWMKFRVSTQNQAVGHGQPQRKVGVVAAAQEVLDCWDSTKWKWLKDGHTATLLERLKQELEADEANQDQLKVAAQAVLDRWNSSKADWINQCPTADLMGALRREVDACASEGSKVTDDSLDACPWCEAAPPIALSMKAEGGYVGYVHCPSCGANGPEAMPRIRMEDALDAARTAWRRGCSRDTETGSQGDAP